MKKRRKKRMKTLPKVNGSSGLYAIETGIPIPEANQMSKLRKYPWFEMKPKDSFFVPNKPPSYVSNAVHKVVKTNPKLKFTCRSENGGTRCWRIA